MIDQLLSTFLLSWKKERRKKLPKRKRRVIIKRNKECEKYEERKKKKKGRRKIKQLQDGRKEKGLKRRKNETIKVKNELKYKQMSE